jgi:hypothetical protein
MKQWFARAACVFLSAASATAATVSFVPQTPTTVQQGEAVLFNIVVSESNLVTFDSVFMLAGSDRVLGFEFEYDSSFLSNTSIPPPPPAFYGVFTTDIGFGGDDFSPPFFSAPLLVGTLIIDTAAAGLGQHEVFVSTDHEMNFFGGASFLWLGSKMEFLEGRATFTVVPEPTSLVVLLLGAALLFGRGQMLRGSLLCEFN